MISEGIRPGFKGHHASVRDLPAPSAEALAHSERLATLIREAMANDAHLMTLEVRATNAVAAQMYERFGFVAEGRRKGYYTDTGEDAIIMTTPDFSDVAWRARVALAEAEAG